MIFKRIDDLTTLSALVHASPNFYKVYTKYRANVYLEVVERELRSRHIGMPEVNITFLEIRIYHPHTAPSRKVHMAIAF